MTNTIPYTSSSTNADGVTINFPFTWKILNEADVVVVLEDGDGVQETLELTTEYSITFTEGENGGNVTTVATYNTPYKIILGRERAYAQPVSITTSQGFSSGSVENNIADNLSMQIQQINEVQNRTIKQRIGNDTELILPNASEGKTLKWTAGGTIENSTYNVDEQASSAAASAAAALVSQTSAASSYDALVAALAAATVDVLTPPVSIDSTYSPYSIPNLTFAKIDSTGGAVSIILPATGKVRVKWDAGTNAITLSVVSSGTINSDSTYVIKTLKDSIDLESTTTGIWDIV